MNQEPNTYLLQSLTITNSGRRPVTMSSVALKMKDGYELAAAESLQNPIELSEGKSVSYKIKQKFVEDKYSFQDIKYIFAVDQTGRLWKGRFYSP